MKQNSKGVQFNDRLLAGRVRNMGLKHLEKILSEDYEDKEFQKQIILKISSSLLPRLNEHTGKDGEDLFPKPLLNGESNGKNN
jgi:hypothetical protein